MTNELLDNQKLRQFVADFLSNFETCESCGGSGGETDDACRNCGGTGRQIRSYGVMVADLYDAARELRN